MLCLKHILDWLHIYFNFPPSTFTSYFSKVMVHLHLFSVYSQFLCFFFSSFSTFLCRAICSLFYSYISVFSWFCFLSFLSVFTHIVTYLQAKTISMCPHILFILNIYFPKNSNKYTSCCLP